MNEQALTKRHSFLVDEWPYIRWATLFREFQSIPVFLARPAYCPAGKYVEQVSEGEVRGGSMMCGFLSEFSIFTEMQCYHFCFSGNGHSPLSAR